MRKAYSISGHAVRQYRARVVRCCERNRSDALLREVIAKQVDELPWRLVGGETFAVEFGPFRPSKKRLGHWVVDGPTHTFLIEKSQVITTLGYLMRTSRKKNRRKRHRRRTAAGRAILAVQMEACPK